MGSKISGIEYYLPAKKETRKELNVDNPDWRMDSIESKTGVEIRHIAIDESALDLAVKASEKLLAGEDKSLIDGLIYVTQSPEYILPTSACVLQDRLGLSTSCMAFDVNLGCSGYVYGLGIASSMLSSSLASKILLVCGDTYTKYIDKHNRTCRPLFSDAASSSLITFDENSAIGPYIFRTDGSGAESLMVKPTNNIPKNSCYAGELYMDGSKVFMFTMSEVPKATHELIEKHNISIEDVDLFIFHQASKLVIDNLVRRLKLPEDKVFRNYKNIGNTVSSTIPIAIKDAVDEGRINLGDTILLVGFGVGLSLGATLIKW